VRRLIAATVAPNGVVCPFENSNAWPVDVYAAALATDNPYESGSPQYKDLGSTTDAPARLWLLDVASVDASGNLVDVPDGKFTQADIAKFLQEFEKRHGDQTPDYSRYDLNGNSVTGEPTKRADYVNVSRFDLDGNLTWTSANKEIEGNAQQFREEMTTDLEVLVYYAYSPLYTGNEYERTMLLLPYFHLLPSPAGLFLRELDINVPLRGTTFQIDAINALGDTFTSLCGVGGERGYPLYSEFVKSQSESGAFNSTGSKLYFWRPTQQFGRIQEKPTNVDNCSSFVAALPGTGLVWINSAARNLDPETNKDEEYQTRFFLGLPDLAAPADGSFKPTPRRVATQTLDYGIVSDAAGPFVQAFATQQLSLIRTGLTP
jgi:hypothetical protein